MKPSGQVVPDVTVTSEPKYNAYRDRRQMAFGSVEYVTIGDIRKDNPIY